ncbi:fimbrial protein [Pseudomonas sp. Fl5BN2]|uniref:fimbrial protein n=1 Tax=unclassified Pseudomonas TaxID=196821 RepID=UPI001378D253|nr:fimbrial protein [Pseudomonas sp. Fl5BN2]NBF12278.1 fimbrial protein [Pseudomonas sp. Fl4BN1]
MKKLFVAAGMASGLLMAAGSAWADGVDVRLEFTGFISTETCSVENTASGTYVHKVDLPPVGSSVLAEKGTVAGLTPFKLKFTGCSGSTVGVWFKPDLTKVDALSGALINTYSGVETASNVQVQLLNSQQQALNLNTITPDDIQKVNVDKGSKDATLNFYAQYLAGADNTTGGPVAASVVLDMVFE